MANELTRFKIPQYKECEADVFGGSLFSQRMMMGQGSKSRLCNLFRAVFKWLSKKPKQSWLLRPITTGADSSMNQLQFLAITCNSLKEREKSRVHGAIGFGFDSHWLKNWRESFKPITKRSNHNHVITFASHLKTALGWQFTLINSVDTKSSCNCKATTRRSLSFSFGAVTLRP